MELQLQRCSHTSLFLFLLYCVTVILWKLVINKSCTLHCFLMALFVCCCPSRWVVVFFFSGTTLIFFCLTTQKWKCHSQASVYNHIFQQNLLKLQKVSSLWHCYCKKKKKDIRINVASHFFFKSIFHLGMFCHWNVKSGKSHGCPFIKQFVQPYQSVRNSPRFEVWIKKWL